jgi:hypothetical protein
MKHFLIVLFSILSISVAAQKTPVLNGSLVRVPGSPTVTVRVGAPIKIPDPEPAPVLPWDTVAVTTFGPWTFENDEYGYFSQAEYTASVLAAGAEGYKRASNSWSSQVSGIHHPHIEYAAVDSAGVITTTKALRVRMVQNIGSKPPSDPYYLPYNSRHYDETDSTQAWLYYAFKLRNTGWDDLGPSYEVKMPGINAGYTEDMDIVAVGDDGWFVKHKMMMKGIAGEDSLRFVTYPRAWADGYNSYLTFVHSLRRYNDTSEVKNFALADTGWHWAALRLTLDPSGTGPDRLEYFIDGYKAMVLGHEPLRNEKPWPIVTDTDLNATDGTLKVDGWQGSMHWGGSWDEFPPSGNADFLLDQVWKGNFTDHAYTVAGITRYQEWPWDKPCPQPPWPHYHRFGTIE